MILSLLLFFCLKTNNMIGKKKMSESKVIPVDIGTI